MSPNSWQDITNGSKNVVTNRPNFASGKGGHDVTEHFGEGGHYVTSDKPSTLKPGLDEKYVDGSYRWTNVTVANCHSRRFVGWTLSLGRNVTWSVCGWTDRQGTLDLVRASKRRLRKSWKTTLEIQLTLLGNRHSDGHKKVQLTLSKKKGDDVEYEKDDDVVRTSASQDRVTATLCTEELFLCTQYI